MCDCANQVVEIASNLSAIELIISMFLFGVSSSFTHCIGMCGAIAISQASMRMMIDNMKPSALRKIACCAAWEYYLGKAITYCFLTFLVMQIHYVLKENKVIKFTLIALVILYFILSIIRVIYDTINTQSKPFKKLHSFERHLNSKNVFIRLMIGVLLGFIPCGIVYAAITTIVSSTNDLLVAVMAILVFGIGTFPGLFLLSYSGSLFIYRFKKLLNIIYILSMVWNIRLLIMMM